MSASTRLGAPASAGDGFLLRLKDHRTWIVLATITLGLSMLAVIFSPVLHHQPLSWEDDADYYRVIARNIAASGASTFDQQTLTNGYHPLWEWTLALQDKLVGDSFLITELIETALVVAAFPLLLIRTGLRSPLGVALFLALFGRTIASLALPGMEVAILVGTTGLLLWVLGRQETEQPWRRAVGLGVALAAAVLSRIDAAVFVLPLVAFAPLKRSTRAIALAVAGAIGAVYVAYNLATFGMALPVSSAIKSLGGLQVNHRFLDQTVSIWRQSTIFSSRIQMLALLALSPVFLALSKPHTLGRAMSAATVVGGIAFVGKLAFGSSWCIWSWYEFPVLFGILAGAMTLGQVAEDYFARRRTDWPAVAGPAVLGLALLIVAGLGVRALVKVALPYREGIGRFDLVNAEAIKRFGPILQGQRVAMGDRAGSFAAFYPGGVTQMEGLVNDKEWLKALETRAELKPILCRRGVKFVLSYQKDLGAYRDVVVPVLRPWLTQFNGPALTLRRSDEIDHFSDRAAYSLADQPNEEGDDVFYLWRLDCEPTVHHERGQLDIAGRGGVSRLPDAPHRPPA